MSTAFTKSHRDSAQGTLARLAVSAGLLAGIAGPLPAADGGPAAMSAEGIREWIGQLGADQFAQREAASRRLAAAGPAALPALAEAARGSDLEVASRAIDIIRGHLDPSQGGLEPAADSATGTAGGRDVAGDRGEGGGEGSQSDRADSLAAVEAERLLETLAEGEPGPVAQLAATCLEFHQLGMHEAARERLEALGAKINDQFLTKGRPGLEVLIDTRWKGATDDLRLLPKIRNLRTVGLHGVKIDPGALATLGRLRGVDMFQFYGTGVTDDDVAALAARFPAADIDVRKGGKLGVGGQRMIGPCQITQVVAGSAADRAGIQVGDVVLSMDGQAVKSFEGLTDVVGRHGPGDSIEVEIERGVAGRVPQRFTCTVTLDGWD